MNTLYVEGSLCMRTSAAGWGSVLSTDEATFQSGGYLPDEFAGAVTLMELCAARAAITRILCGTHGRALTIAMRSTAALAVLRWVFPDAPFSGAAEVCSPKRLKSGVKDAQCLYDIHDIVELTSARISLMHVTENEKTRLALGTARLEMERARTVDRRIAR